MKRILAIDDDEKILLLLKIRLKAAGYEVLTAENGKVGLEMALAQKPDLVVTDIWMPVGGGFSIAHRLREVAPEVPVIFVTASKQEELRSWARGLGAAGFIEKPYTAEELLAVVARTLNEPPPAPSAIRKAPEPAVAAVPQLPTPSAEPDLPTSPTRGKGRKMVLIVDDDRKIAMALAFRLRVAGLDVLMAYDALQGLDSAVKNQPDLVLLDVGLPAGSGLALAERIQALVPRLTPVIFMTARRQPELRQKAMALGASAFFEKPFEDAELMAAIDKALHPVVNTGS